MQLKHSTTRSTEAGGSLLATLIISTMLGTAALGYLSLISQQSKLSTRSQAWNLSIGVAEAGVEEAMEQLNSNFASLTTDGWTYTGTAYYVTRTFSNGNSYT